MEKLIYICLFLVGVTVASGQSATNFNTDAIGTSNTDKKKAAASAEIESNLTTPSRLVEPAAVVSYVKSYEAILSMRSRARDPFGQNQDPNAKPEIKAPVTARNTKRVTSAAATPLADVVKLIVITTIMPREKRFLIGTRSVKKGDELPVNFRGKKLRIQVVDVTSQQILFRNAETGETATHKLDLMPAGMQPGNRGIKAPGMVPNIPNAPIDLDPTVTPL